MRHETLAAVYARHYSRVGYFILDNVNCSGMVECTTLAELTGIELNRKNHGVYTVTDRRGREWQLNDVNEYDDLINEAVWEKGDFYWTKRDAERFINDAYKGDNAKRRELLQDLRDCKKSSHWVNVH